jgi:DNA (cytosine-5)-methyltransferase 1
MLDMVKMKPVCIDLCCGAGGLSYGFEQAGFDVSLGLDIDEEALSTYKKNRPGINVAAADIRRIGMKEILGHLPAEKREVDGVLAAPPCRGFSQSNRRSRNLDNPLNLLYLDVLRIIGDLKPSWFLIENVWGLQQVANGQVEAHIIQLGNLIGYSVAAKVLNAADYGIPQTRRRIFFVGLLGRDRFTYPKPNGELRITVREAIGDLPSLVTGDMRDILPYRLWGDQISEYQLSLRGSKGQGLVNGNLVTHNNETVLQRYTHIPPGGNWKNIPPMLMTNYSNPKQCHTGIYRRLEWHAPSVVISNFRKNMLIHPEENRGLSIREAARLQSFPDSFVFQGSLGSQQQQVADAVPPLLAFTLAEAIRRSS